jgi:hypothetical protein
MKIFVTGFQRSGTTLVKDLIDKHPDVKIMFHESKPRILSKNKKELYNSKKIKHKIIPNNYQGTKDEFFKINLSLKNDNWGEKIPYYLPKITKQGGGFVWNYCIRWNNYFEKESRIVHIVRHPFDVAESTVKRGFKKHINQVIKQYQWTIPIVIDNIQKVENVLHIQFETLLKEPEKILKKIYKFCNLDYSDDVIKGVLSNKNIFRYGKINPKRAYQFKKKNENWKKYDINPILKKLNTLEGINYEID